MYLTDLVEQAVRSNPDGAAVLGAETRTTWREFGAGVARAAGALRSIGIVPGDRVAVLGANSPRLIEMHYATLWAGAVLVPLNTRLGAPELEWIVRDSEPALLVSDSRLCALADAVAGAVAVPQRLDLDRDEDSAGILGHGALMRRAQPLAKPERGPELAALYYTGGTTGLPKGVMLSHHSLLIQTENYVKLTGIDARSVSLHAMPLFHVAGTAGAHSTTRSAGTHVFMAQFDPSAVFATIREHGVDVLSLAPTSYAALLDSPARDDTLLAGVRVLIYGSAPITPALLGRLLAAFPNARMLQLYGQTECGGACLGLPPDRHTLSGTKAGKLHCAGEALPDFEVRVVDDRRIDRPPGASGEIVVSGPGLMLGYWRAPERSEKALRDGWLHTGDVGVRDAEGFIAVVDRLKDMIVSGGENVYCSEVEAAIAAHPDVESCAVLGIPDERWGEAVHAVVVPRAGRSPGAQQIIDFCRERIAGYKCPKSVTLRSEALPLSGVGKVQKNLLREELQKR